MDAMRKQLDRLMGANRNGDVREVNHKDYDRDVCRLYLAGLCPHELFHLTKMDKGPYPKVHSLQLRKEYEEAKAKGIDNYDTVLEYGLYKLIDDCDRKIGKALKRLDDEDAKAATSILISEVTKTTEVLKLSKQIKEKLKEVDDHDLEGKTDLKIRALEVIEEFRNKMADNQSMLFFYVLNKDKASLLDPLTQELINEKLKKAEELGEQGMIDEAEKALEEAEALRKLPARQEPVSEPSKFTSVVQITDKKLRVCDICGAFLRIYDSESRLAEHFGGHFGGKVHQGYMQIREKLAELQDMIDRYDDRRLKEQSGDRDRESSRDREGADSRERGRDYGHRSRDRGYNRDRDRDSDRSRSYESRSRRRSRSRSRDYDRDRHSS